MSSAEEVHVTALSVVFSGVKTAFRRNSPFTSKEAEAGLTPRPVKGTGTADTVTAQAADLEEFDLETAVMVTVPGDFPVTPPSATEAMWSSFEVHVRDLSASAGVMTGVSVTVAFTVTEAAAGSVMLSTETPPPPPPPPPPPRPAGGGFFPPRGPPPPPLLPSRRKRQIWKDSILRSR